MLSREEVEHVAKLARIKLSDKEILKMQEELVKILDYINQLEKVDVEGIIPTTHSVPLKNIFRKDEISYKEESEELIKLAPQRKGKFIKIKPIFS